MPFDYDRVAPAYDRHRTGRGPYLDHLHDLARAAAPGRRLELAAGTGNQTAALVAAAPGPIVALEFSAGMIAQARAKGAPGAWTRGSALHLPFADGAFAFLFGAYFLHHIADLDGLFHECARVLQDGLAVFVTVPERFILNHPMNAYFPSFAAIDAARFQPIGAVTTALRQAGFRDVAAHVHVDDPKPVDAAYVEKIANRFISTYDLLPADEFSAGLERLRADVAGRGALAEPMRREAAVVTGRA